MVGQASDSVEEHISADARSFSLAVLHLIAPFLPLYIDAKMSRDAAVDCKEFWQQVHLVKPGDGQ